ncbi:hypothetical protein GCM10009083_23400 [Halopseudomonas pertucinogena]|uniref:Uncharacterized protein n=1 Tax=Halopseudomonas pertucinogena TaxID=86175 RepID=A0ABQ2CRF8_9GAMM|nr:hypothetical protein GCM10009083_23400 [Halopseudomonas pertucinogena]
MLPRQLDGLGQTLGMGSKGFAIKGQTLREHATHRLAVVEELLERSLAFAFRRVRVGRTAAATGQNKAQGSGQQNSGIWN